MSKIIRTEIYFSFANAIYAWKTCYYKARRSFDRGYR